MDSGSALITPGARVAGKYRVERVLKSGGMGIVVAAVHEGLGERVAIKFLQPGILAHPELVQRFMQEAKNSVRVKNDHAVRVYDVDQTDAGIPYLVMEMLEGRDLADVLAKEGAKPAAVAVDMVAEACEAIAEAHAAGIVHRDLKPANLFLARGRGGQTIVKVLDFGIAKMIRRDFDGDAAGITSSYAMMGTPAYMSPEQLRSSKDVDPRADIWSLGVLLHELMSGALPFAGESAAEVCAGIFRDKPKRLSDLRPEIPGALSAVVSKCLKKERDARYPDILSLVAALAPFGTSRSTEALENIRRRLRSDDTLPEASGLVAVQGYAGPARSVTPFDFARRARTTAAVRRGTIAAGALLLVVLGAVGTTRMLRTPAADLGSTGAPPVETVVVAAPPVTDVPHEATVVAEAPAERTVVPSDPAELVLSRTTASTVPAKAAHAAWTTPPKAPKSSPSVVADAGTTLTDVRKPAASELFDTIR
ncbi:MAG: protein kinase [Polyangiaceae bacterium]